MATTTFSHRQYSAADVAGLLDARGFEVAEPIARKRTILESFDGRLHDAGLRLEYQCDHEQRLVLTAAGSVTASAVVDRQPRYAADLPAGPFRPRLTPVLQMRALLALTTFTDVVRVGAVRDGADKITVSIEIHEPIRPTDTNDGAALPMLVELNEVVGHHKTAAKTRRLLFEAGFEEFPSPLVGLVLAATGVDPAGFNSSPTVALDPVGPAIVGFRAVFRNLSATMAANWQGTLEDVDSEFLHELRVAIRRTRSVLGHGKGVIPEEIRQRYREEFAWLASLTGTVRDLDVYILEWDGYVRHLAKDRSAHLKPVLLHVQQSRDRAFRQMVDDLTSDRARALIAAWDAMLLHPEMGPESAPKAHRQLRLVIAKRIRDANQALIDNGRAIQSDSPAAALHDLRKDAKKLRYAIECFASLLPNPDRKAFVRQLKGLQDNLGQHQDAEVHSASLQTMAHELPFKNTEPDTFVALGQLIEHLALDQQTARSEFNQRFADYDSAKTREILARMLEAMTR